MQASQVPEGCELLAIGESDRFAYVIFDAKEFGEWDVRVNIWRKFLPDSMQLRTGIGERLTSNELKELSGLFLEATTLMGSESLRIGK